MSGRGKIHFTWHAFGRSVSSQQQARTGKIYVTVVASDGAVELWVGWQMFVAAASCLLLVTNCCCVFVYFFLFICCVFLRHRRQVPCVQRHRRQSMGIRPKINCAAVAQAGITATTTTAYCYARITHPHPTVGLAHQPAQLHVAALDGGGERGGDGYVM